MAISNEVEFATTAVTGDDQNILAAGVAGEKIRVLAASGVLKNVVTGTHAINSDTTAIAQLTAVGMVNHITDAAPTSYCMPYSPVGWCETADGEDLILDSDTASGICTITVAFIRMPA